MHGEHWSTYSLVYIALVLPTYLPTYLPTSVQPTYSMREIRRVSRKLVN